MSSRRQSPAPKKNIPIKRADGEPLTRADIQYDVLSIIFSDPHKVFTDPYASPNDQPPAKLTFHDLYIKAIMQSPKATKALKDKMTDTLNFAEDFAMLALLVNVGRINTTMSFFPEMKTTIRTYHPIPALQRTTGNLQDAPRIKHILKASLLDSEIKSIPLTPADILGRGAEQTPSTSVSNLLFSLSSHSNSIGLAHFSGTIDFIDIFIRPDVSSASRARAFLWLCYHYLEAPSDDNDDDDYDNDAVANPFSDPKRGKMISFTILSPEEVAQENIESEQDREVVEKLLAQRNKVLSTQGAKQAAAVAGKVSIAGSVAGDDEEELTPPVEEVKPKTKRGAAASRKTATSAAKEKKAAADKLRRDRIKEEKARERERELKPPAASMSDDDDDGPPELSAPMLPPSLQNQYPQHHYQYEPQHSHAPLMRSQPLRSRYSSQTPEPEGPKSHRYSPYRFRSDMDPGFQRPRHSQKSRSHEAAPVSPRSMLQHAWHIVNTTDPLIDSDDELGDEYVRQDYIARLQVITRLRGKAPTPEPELHHADSGTEPRPGLHRGNI